MSLRRRLLSFRARFLLIVLGAAVLPVLVLGVWLTRQVARSGEDLVRGRLEAAVNAAAGGVGQRWMLRRSVLLDVAETPTVRRAVTDRAGAAPGGAVSADGATTPGGAAAAGWAGPAFGPDLEGVQAVRLLDRASRPLAEHSGPGGAGASIPMALAVHDGPLGEPIGTLEARVTAVSLLPDGTPAPGGMGAILGLYEPGTLAPLVPLPFEIGDALPAEVEWGGERWLTAVRRLEDPSVLLVAAAPVSPFAEPFRAAAREGTAVLAVAGLAAFLLAVLLTTRMTRSLGRLAAAAEAVARGDLDLRVDEAGEDEVSRVGHAFNRMTASLRDTLQELADHRALAAVGEFAASLAHEIRNPLSAVRLDLQVVEEELPADSSLRGLQRRALSEIERMDATLAGALQTARSGRYRPAPVRLDEPLEAAVAAARPGTAGDGPAIVRDEGGAHDVEVAGDAGALRQLFLNLLLNALEAAGPGGRVHVRLERRDGAAVVEISDDGPGVSEELRPRVFEPLVSGRPGGTGLGLSIADRIARAHGGAVELADAPGGGTAARVRLPLYDGGAAAGEGMDEPGAPSIPGAPWMPGMPPL